MISAAASTKNPFDTGITPLKAQFRDFLPGLGSGVQMFKAPATALGNSRMQMNVKGDNINLMV